MRYERLKISKRCFVSFVLFIVVIGALILGSYRDVIFQRGNPIPYMIASMRISETTPYVEVGKDTGIFISKKGLCPQLFLWIEENQGFTFVEQFGSGYQFTNGQETMTVSSQIYWGKFTVWQVPIGYQ